MSLILEIQNDATDSSVDISTALRKAKILATRLKSRELNEWADSELNGYAKGSLLPTYRVLKGQARGSFILGHLQASSLAIPESILPDNLKPWANSVRLFEPIAAYVSLIARSGTDRMIAFGWPVELARAYGSKAYVNAQCLSAWLAVDISALVALVDSVRNRLLNFALVIGEENPDAGEADPRATPIAPGIVSTVVNNTIYGGTNNLAVGDFQQDFSFSVSPGDISALRGILETAGALPAEVADLEASMAHAESATAKQGAADSWIGRTARGALAASREFIVEISAKAIAEYLKPPGA